MLLPAPAKGRREQHLASAPSRGATQVLFLYFQSLAAQVGGFGRKQFSLLAQRIKLSTGDHGHRRPFMSIRAPTEFLVVVAQAGNVTDQQLASLARCWAVFQVRLHFERHILDLFGGDRESPSGQALDERVFDGINLFDLRLTARYNPSRGVICGTIAKQLIFGPPLLSRCPMIPV